MTAPAHFAGAADLAPCGIRHVDLDRGDRTIAAGAGECAVYVVFWRAGRPIGDRIFVGPELPVPGSAVAALAADAAAWSARDGSADPPSFAGPMPPPRISVVVCTRDRPASLERCLVSLSRCDPAPAEIVVIDNAPHAGQIRGIVASRPGLRYIAEPRPGLSHARNTGVEATSGDVIAFTDDDVEVTADWIARLAVPFADPLVACVTGAVLPADLSGEGACLFEFTSGGLNNGFARRRFDAKFLRQQWWKSPPVWAIGAGANMAIRRSAFATVGLFDPRLGAGAAGCSEDSELWFRLLRAGLHCFYDPAAVVHHYHRPNRQEVNRQMRAYLRGHVVALMVQFSQDHRVAHLLRPVVIIPIHYLRQLARLTGRGDWKGVHMIFMQVLGCAMGPFDALRRLARPGPPHLGEGSNRK